MNKMASKDKKKKVIFWIIVAVLVIALFFVINHYAGFIDFKSLFVAGDTSPSSFGGAPGSGGITG